MRLKHSRGNWVVAILACCWPQHISSFSSSSSLSPSINSCKSIHCFITELVRKNQQEQNAPTTTRVRQQSHPSLCLLWWNLCHQLLSEFWVGLTDGWFWIEYQRHTDTTDADHDPLLDKRWWWTVWIVRWQYINPNFCSFETGFRNILSRMMYSQYRWSKMLMPCASTLRNKSRVGELRCGKPTKTPKRG